MSTTLRYRASVRCGKAVVRRQVRCRAQRQAFEDGIESNPIFSDSLRMALRDAAARQGSSSFGVETTKEDEQDRSQEELLIAALASSRRNLKQMRTIQLEVRLAVEREEKQVERLEFAINKARSDAAYYHTVERMLKNQRQ